MYVAWPQQLAFVGAPQKCPSYAGFPLKPYHKLYAVVPYPIWCVVDNGNLN